MAINIRKKDDERPGGEQGDGEQEPIGDEAGPADADPFIRSSVDAVTWFSENQNTVLAGIAILAVAGIGAYIAFNQYRSAKVEASSAWGESIAHFERPVSGSEYVTSLKQTDFNLPDDLIYGDLKTKWEAVNKEAKKTLETYDKSNIAGQARLTRAAAAYRLGDYETAVKQYDQYLGDKPSKELEPVVYYGAGLANGAAGNVEKATELFGKMAEADSEYEVLALYQQGIVHEEAGNLKKAKEMYDKALDSGGASSPYKTDIKRRRTLISVRE